MQITLQPKHKEKGHLEAEEHSLVHVLEGNAKRVTLAQQLQALALRDQFHHDVVVDVLCLGTRAGIVYAQHGAVLDVGDHDRHLDVCSQVHQRTPVPCTDPTIL